MPGRRLRDEERGLQTLWNNPPAGLERPFLESVAVGGGLRGIDGLFVPFRYPISAICGKNGVGKTTILALAALAYHSPAEWDIPNWLYQPQRKGQGRAYYTFRDFFLRTDGERSFDGVSVTWNYRHPTPRDPVTFEKTPHRWGRYSDRPEREVAFIPVGRLLPAHEVPGVRSAFSNETTGVSISKLPRKAVEQLGYIMGSEYRSAEVHETKRHTFQHAQSSAGYSAFNMGSGESWVMNLLRTLHEIPRGGLLVIEEVEAGLHPEAQERLAEVLVDICLRRHMQIVCSTHSTVFLDALPRQARLLLRRRDDFHEVIESPSTRFAFFEMTGHVRPELTIYCEDITARMLIEEALPHELRVRTSIREIGDRLAVVRQCVSHLRSGYEMRAICIFDGDCLEREIERHIAIESAGRESLKPVWMSLPGGSAPESWAIDQLSIDPYRDSFAEQFRCSVTEAKGLIEAARAELDHHNLGHCLHQRTSIDAIDCTRWTMRAVAPRHPQLEGLRDLVKRELG